MKKIKLRIEKYTSKKYDKTIIEIKEEDNINKYIELDEVIFKEIQDICNQNIYIIQYPRIINTEKTTAVSYGVLSQIQDELNILHKYSTKGGSSGSPILNLSNYKLIGIHKEDHKFEFNKGTYLKYPINEYLNNINIINKNKEIKNKKNEINITLKIKKYDINHTIYFLDNTYGKYDFGDKLVEHYHDNLKEINEKNTELYIYNKKDKYSKYFKPEKEGIYEIKKYNINITDCSFMFSDCKNI